MPFISYDTEMIQLNLSSGVLPQYCFDEPMMSKERKNSCIIQNHRSE